MFLGVLLYLTILSIVAIILMKIDKSRAQRNGRRIPERTLWRVAIFGGGIGAYIGMMAFRHKTKHTNFRVGFLALAILQTALVIWLYIENEMK